MTATSEALPASLAKRTAPQMVTLTLGEEVVIGKLRLWAIEEHVEDVFAPDGHKTPSHWERFLRASTCRGTETIQPDCYASGQISDSLFDNRATTADQMELRAGRERVRLLGLRTGALTVSVEHLTCEESTALALPAVGDHLDVWMSTEGMHRLTLTNNGKELGLIDLSSTELQVLIHDGGVRTGRLRLEGVQWTTVDWTPPAHRRTFPSGTDARAGAVTVGARKVVLDGPTASVLVRIERIDPPLAADPPHPTRDTIEN